MSPPPCLHCGVPAMGEPGCGGYFCTARWLTNRLARSLDYHRLGADYALHVPQEVAHIIAGWGADVRELTSSLYDRGRPWDLPHAMLQAQPDAVTVSGLTLSGGATWFGSIAWDAILCPMRASVRPRDATHWLRRVAPVYQDTPCLQRILTVSRLAGAGRASELVEELLPLARPAPTRAPSRLLALLNGVA